jgi:hypothetical protein
MDFSAKLDDLQQRAAHAKVDVDLAAMNARQQVGEAAASARSKWAQMKADDAAKLDDFEAKMDRRADQRDATEFAAWTVDRARLAVLDAIDTRVYADEFAQQGRRQ